MKGIAYSRMENDICIIGLSGRIDSNTNDIINDEFDKYLDTGAKKYLFDCKDVDYINSTGISTIMVIAEEIYKANNWPKPAIVGLDSDSKMMFEAIGLKRWSEFFDNLDEGMKYLQNTIVNVVETKDSEEFVKSYLSRNSAENRNDKSKGSAFNEIDINDPVLLIQKGCQKYLQKDFESAVNFLSKAIFLDESNATSYLWRGKTYFRLGKFIPAKADYLKALKINPENAAVSYSLALLLFREGILSDALQFMDQVIALAPNVSEYYMERSRIKISMRDFKGAAADCNYALSISPKDKELYHLRNIANVGDNNRSDSDQYLAEDDDIRYSFFQLVEEVKPKIEENKYAEFGSIVLQHSELGGDFCSFFKKYKDTLSFAIGDVSGKGSPATLIADYVLKQMQFVNEKSVSPAEILSEVNRNYLYDFPYARRSSLKFFITASYYILENIDKDTYRLTYSNAGHLNPIIFRKSSSVIAEPKSQGFALGISEQSEYKEYQLKLFSGDFLILVTDGFFEQTNENGDFYGWDRLKSSIQRNSHFNLQYLMDKIIEELDEFRQTQERDDDRTLLGIRIL